MDKKELLKELDTKIEAGELSREEIMDRIGVISPKESQAPSGRIFGISNISVTYILYVIGIAIVIIGIVYFVSNLWNDIGSLGRIVVTFGLGVLIASIGSMLLKRIPNQQIGSAFHSIGGILVPAGAMLTLSELGIDDEWTMTLAFAAIFFSYVPLSLFHKNAVLTFFAIANGTITVFMLMNALAGGLFSGLFRLEDVYLDITMIIGASYLLLSHAFRDGWNSSLVGALHLFGSLAILGPAMMYVFDSVAWQLFYFVVLFGGLALSVYLKSKSILLLSTLFLIGHIVFITGEYFANSIGWPISLVILGFVFILLGYISWNINERHIKNLN